MSTLFMTHGLSIYIVPPALSLLCGLYLVALALIHGPHTTEKRLFALVCLWYSLLSPLFICHQLIADPALILAIERKVHFFYVFLPLVTIAFVRYLLNIHRNDILMVLFAISALFGWTTQSDLYIAGLYKYSWGYIAKGGPAFQLFGIYGAIGLIYCVTLFRRRLKVETDPKLRVKFAYMAASFGLTVFLTFLNIPAMHGMDFYPLSNFSFLPMAILAYSLLKYRVVRISSLLQVSLLRVIFILMVLVPNIFLFVHGFSYIAGLSPEAIFVCLTAWFAANYFIVYQVRRLLGKLLSKTRRQLQRAEAELIKEILVLSRVEPVCRKVSMAIQANLPFEWARIYVCGDGPGRIIDPDGRHHILPEALAAQLLLFSGWIENQSLKTPAEIQPLTTLLSMLKADSLVPLAHQGGLVGLLALPHKANRQPIHPDEAAFINNISQALALAISNAMMFQRITILKDNLQGRTEALSQEITERQRAEQSLREVQEELRETNFELQKAILQANEMTAKVEINNHVLTQEMEERKRIEAALRKNEAMYRLITDNSTDVIWTIDLKGHFTYMSPSVRHHMGHTPQEALVLKIQDVLTPASLQMATKVIAEDMELVSSGAGAQRKTRTLELEFTRRDGSTVWGEVNTRFIKNEGGEVSGILGITRDITDRRTSEQALHFLAYHDALTGLYNRKAFIELLENEIKYAQRYDSGLTLLFFDLNRFKRVNDTYGHEIGDRLLKAVADRVKAAVRDSDIVFRLGGDEFTIILKAPEEISAEGVVARIVENLAEPYPFDDLRVDFVSASIGTAVFPRDGATAGELMRNADRAMYAAKKNDEAWRCYTPAMRPTERCA